MPFCRIRSLRYVCLLIVVFFLIQILQKTPATPSYTYDAAVHEFVPDDLRHIVRRSYSSYNTADLRNITDISNTFQEFHLTSSNNSVHLITQWYYEIDRRRRKELVNVLHMNLLNPAITTIHLIQNADYCSVFDDTQIEPDFPHYLLKSKLKIFYQTNVDENRRLTIDQAFRYANRLMATGYTILVNLDTFFDQSLLNLKHRPLLDEKTVLYLSRYEVDPSITTLGLQCSEQGYVGSHDALIFRAPLSNDVVDQLPFEIGTWHIEVKIISELIQAEYVVRNPCKSIRVWHLHSSQVRHRLMPSKKYMPDRLLSRVLRYPEFL